MKLSFSLANSKSKANPVGTAPSLKRPAAFASLDDETTEDAAPTASSSKAKGSTNQQLIAQNVEMSKAQRKKMEAEKKVDATVFQYDEVWENIQDARLRQKEAKEAESRERKPKYINGLLTSAATRRLDHLRAEEKMIQREREMEGDEFKDKEAFVTQAYKDQMAEVRRAEEEERQREEAQKKKGGSSTGLAHFYRKMLEESEQKHEETVAAAQHSERKTVQGPQGPAPNLTITKPPEPTSLSDIQLAKLASEEGKHVELNENNEIVDKRELLSAGLNLAAPNTRRLGVRATASTTANDTASDPGNIHRAAGTAATRKEINERRRREILEQMEEQRRHETEKEREEREANARVVPRRNDDAAIQSALERYRARKRQKLETQVGAESQVMEGSTT